MSQKREERHLPPDHRAQIVEIETCHTLQRDDRGAECTEGDRCRVRDERKPGCLQRLEAERDEQGARDRDGRPEARGALEERTEAERDEEELEPAITR